MKRIVLLLLLFTMSLEAAETVARRRYLVGTLPGTHDSATAAFETDEREARRLRRFEGVEGFVVDLTDAEAAAMAGRSDVRFVEPDALRFVADDAMTERMDGRQLSSYGVRMVEANPVWAATRGEGVRVGIIDTGIDVEHPDLAAAFAGGWDFIHEDAIPEEEAIGQGYAHGTRMAGVIAAADNAFGVVGVAPGVALYALKVFPQSGGARTSDIIRALQWAVANHLDVVNCSFGGDDPSELEAEAYQAARDANVLVIAAVGNDGTHVRYPAAYASVAGVSAVDRSGSHATFSNRGAEVDLVAPGVDVMSTMRIGRGRVGSVLLDNGIAFAAHPLELSPIANREGSVVDCRFAAPGPFPAEVNGNVALVERGGQTPRDKADAAMKAGARAMILVNTTADELPFRGTLGYGSARTPVVVSVTPGNGAAILGHTGTVRVDSYVTDYEASDGTSLSAPFVAGVAALIRALRPDLTAGAVLDVLLRTAKDLGAPGCDELYGCGLVSAFAAAQEVAPERFVHVPKPKRRAAGPR
jgi:subtilisin family serine protease